MSSATRGSPSTTGSPALRAMSVTVRRRGSMSWLHIEILPTEQRRRRLTQRRSADLPRAAVRVTRAKRSALRRGLTPRATRCWWRGRERFGGSRSRSCGTKARLSTSHPSPTIPVQAVALGINEHGTIVTAYQEDGPRKNSLGYVYDSGIFTRLEGSTRGEFAALLGWDINERGDVAGDTSHPWGSPDQARVWSLGCFGACCRND